MLQTLKRLASGSATTRCFSRTTRSPCSRSLLFIHSKRHYATAPTDAQKTQLDEVEKARAVLESRKSGTFTTVDLRISRNQTIDPESNGPPLFGSLMPYVLMARKPGVPVIALRKDEKHYSNIQSVSKSSLTVFPLTPPHINPSLLPLPKVNLVGDLKIVLDQDEIEAMIDRYDEVHKGSRKFVADKEVFEFYEFEPSDAYYVRSTGDNVQFTGKQFMMAPSDPIARQSRVLMDKINNKYSEELKKMCKEYGDTDVDEVFIFGLDRLGFDLMGRVSEGSWLEFRFPLPSEITNIGDYEASLEQSVQKMKTSSTSATNTNKAK
eukprot:TRINITY_DN13584_c0_g1_i1.p1 TRINITY_DN13584_c0_g1~~TRINITY_DN13584_c0_g1_i1.p1  ORF type:complete len:322 (+),score=38.64 TRINITY_DN13584_c0_g1_i1:157-1122(+)